MAKIQDNNEIENSTIDVVIPVYNGAKYILEAVDSVVNQTVKAAFIIVIDDGSTDETAELVNNYISKHKSDNIIFHRKSNGGLSSARNQGIKLSTSKYIAFLDADDVWDSKKLEYQFTKIVQRTNRQETGVIYCDFTLIDETGQNIDRTNNSHIIKSIKGKVFSKLLKGNYVSGSGSAVLVRKEVFDKCGNFDESLPSCEDWDMWLRIAREYDYDFVNEKLVKIRRHSDGMQQNYTKMILGHLLLFNKLYIKSNLTIRHLLLLRAQMHDARINCHKFINNMMVDSDFKKLICSKRVSIVLLFFLGARRIFRHSAGLRLRVLDIISNFVY